MTRLSGYFDRWIELGSIEKDFDNLHNLIITEQVLNMCSKELRLFIEERGPKTMADMTSVAEHYLEVHRKLYSHWSNRNDRIHGKGQGQTPSSSKSQFQGKVKGSEYRSQAPKTSGKSCFVCSSTSHLARDSPQRSSKVAPPRTGGGVDGGKGPQTGFAVRELPGSVQLKTDDGELLTLTVGEDGTYTRQTGTGTTMKLSFTATRVENLPVTVGRVKGQDDIEVLRDTGCTGVVVKKSLCSDNDFTGEMQACMLLDRSTQLDPVVRIQVDTSYFKGEVRAIAMEWPVYDLVIGNIPGARAADDPDKDWEPDDMVAGAVVTRRQAKVKKLSPLKVAKSPDLKMDTTK